MNKLSTVGHTGIHAWGNRVRRQFFGGGAVVVEPKSPGFSRGACQGILTGLVAGFLAGAFGIGAAVYIQLALMIGAWFGAKATHLAPMPFLKAVIVLMPLLGGLIMMMFQH